VKQIRKRLTYANVMSSIAVFLVLGGATAIAAKKIGTKQLKANSVTTGKIKKNAVTTAKIKNNAVTGAKVHESTLGEVPLAANATTTSVIKTSKGTVSINQEATALEHGPLKIIVKCLDTNADNDLEARAYIASSTDGTVFASWEDGSKTLGPSTAEADRELNAEFWVDSTGPFAYDGPSDVNVSATAAGGASFNAYVGLASEKDTGTCWYWLNATILG
jgi:hypothetical protein